MQFTQFATILAKLEATTSRLAITEILADLFKKAERSEIDKIVYLSLGMLAPSYESIVFNIAEKMMLDVVAQAYGKEKKAIIAIYKEKGDLGDVAYQLASKGSKSRLQVSEVYKALVIIAKDEGAGSQERKVTQTAALLAKLDGLSCKFVVRMPVGKLRLGFSDLTIIDALSWVLTGDKSLSPEIKKAYEVMPDIGKIAKIVKAEGVAGLKSVSPQIFVPVLPMLCQRLKSPKDMLKKMGMVAVEPKLDGLRILIHADLTKNKFKAYTRNLNETSWMFPEFENLKKYIKAKTVILDCEAIGVDELTRKLANFQTTMTRRRKHDIGDTSKKIPIVFYVFDMLLKDGKNLMQEPYTKRRVLLEETVREGNSIRLVDMWETTDPNFIAEKNEELKSEGLEGIIVKKLDGKYVPGRTAYRWVKMKEAEMSIAKLSDTLDCVVMGYTRGKGKRAVFGVGQFLAGVADGDIIKTITKVGTGLTDDQFRDLNKRLEKIKTNKKPKQYNVHKDLEPDFWVEPDLVVELAADEITISPKHTSGFALRFPRLVNFRDDKKYTQATTTSEVKKIARL